MDADRQRCRCKRLRRRDGLLQTRLTHIDVRGSLKMVGPNFLVHRRSLLMPQRGVPHPRFLVMPRPEAPLGAVVPPDPGTEFEPPRGASATGLVGRTSAFVAAVDARSGCPSSPPACCDPP